MAKKTTTSTKTTTITTTAAKPLSAMERAAAARKQRELESKSHFQAPDLVADEHIGLVETIDCIISDLLEGIGILVRDEDGSLIENPVLNDKARWFALNDVNTLLEDILREMLDKRDNVVLGGSLRLQGFNTSEGSEPFTVQQAGAVIRLVWGKNRDGRWYKHPVVSKIIRTQTNFIQSRCDSYRKFQPKGPDASSASVSENHNVETAVKQQ